MGFLKKQPDHSRLREVDPYSFAVLHRRMAWMLRLSAATNVALLGVVSVLVATISALTPLKEVQLALLHTDPEDKRTYRIEPISKEVPGFLVLMEDKAQRFVKLLLTIDAVNQPAWLDKAYTMMGQDFYDRFYAERIESHMVQDAIAEGLNREILIDSVVQMNSLHESDGVYVFAVSFVQRDSYGGEVVSEKNLTAYLSMTTDASQVPADQKYENPTGIVVLDMVLKARGEGG